MGDRLIGVTDVSPGAAVVAEWRTRDKGSGVLEQYAIPVHPRDLLFRGSATTFRFWGGAVTSRHLFYMKNGSASRRVAIRGLIVRYNPTLQEFGTWAAQFSLSRPAADATGGTALTKTPWDTALSSDAGVVVRGPSSADMTNATTSLTAITATAGTNLWRQRIMRWPTAAQIVGQVRTIDDKRSADLEANVPATTDSPERMHAVAEDGSILLLPGQRALVTVTAADTGDIDTAGFLTMVCWDEYQIP
jgi:hypothetical protein